VEVVKTKTMDVKIAVTSVIPFDKQIYSRIQHHFYTTLFIH